MASFSFSSSGSDGRLKVPVMVAVRQAAMSLFSTNGEHRKRRQIGKGGQSGVDGLQQQGLSLANTAATLASTHSSPGHPLQTHAGTRAAKIPLPFLMRLAPGAPLSASQGNQRLPFIHSLSERQVRAPSAGKHRGRFLQLERTASSNERPLPSPPVLLAHTGPCRRVYLVGIGTSVLRTMRPLT